MTGVSGAPTQDDPPEALSGTPSMLGRLLRLEQHFKQLEMGRADRELWANAKSLRDLGELTARWLEGDIESQVGYAPYVGPSDETQDLIPTLAALNRAGYLTIGSQPGTEGDNGQTSWMQQASVQGFADDAVLERIRNACESTSLVVRAYQTPKRKWPFRGRLDKGGPLALTAWGGNQMGLSDVQCCLNGVGDEAWDEEAHRASGTDEERAAAAAVEADPDPAGWQSTLDIDVPEWVATQGSQAVADYLARVAAETSETVGTEDQPPAGSAGDGPTTTVRADRDLVAAAEETRAAAYEAGDRLRQAQQRDADDETHQSAVDLEQTEAGSGAAEQDAAEAAAALATELAGDDPELRGKPDGEPSTEELVAAAREACAELADDQDEIADPVADVPVVDESAVADDAAVVAAQDTVGGAA